MKISVYLTFSKICAGVIILMSILYGFIYKDSTVFLAGIGIGAAGLGWRQHNQTIKNNGKN